MKRARRILSSLILIAVAIEANPSARAQSVPQITLAYRSGKRLVVQGTNFLTGAAVLINGQPEPTISEPDSPNVLILKKGKKWIAGLSHVGIQVRNPDGATSNEYDLDQLLTVTLADNGQTINLNQGNRLFVFLGTTYNWSFPPGEPFDTNVIAPVPGVGTLIIGAQALLQAVGPGQTMLTLDGDPPCRNSTPPCEIPSIRFQITVIVQ